LWGDRIFLKETAEGKKMTIFNIVSIKLDDCWFLRLFSWWFKITVHACKLWQLVKVLHNRRNYWFSSTRTILNTLLTKARMKNQYAVNDYWPETFLRLSETQLENFGKTTVVAADATALLFWKQIGKYLDSSDSVWKALNNTV